MKRVIIGNNFYIYFIQASKIECLFCVRMDIYTPADRQMCKYVCVCVYT
jgi:hypothetical protein